MFFFSFTPFRRFLALSGKLALAATPLSRTFSQALRSFSSNLISTPPPFPPSASSPFPPPRLLPQGSSSIQTKANNYRQQSDVFSFVDAMWQLFDFARLNHMTTYLFINPKTNSVSFRWSRSSLNASKVRFGLAHDSEALTLAFQDLIEAIDPRHHYGHNLHIYYDVWTQSQVVSLSFTGSKEQSTFFQLGTTINATTEPKGSFNFNEIPVSLKMEKLLPLALFISDCTSSDDKDHQHGQFAEFECWTVETYQGKA
ncbi:hypothetical protein FCM35_KLT05834 [Carex littledalei]|uniref:Uncharacterized protein n=1 Tax=Carex littledalei TaxID=544730 RepID=A0A833QW62_9POAL|nr:hypothetical protein FCM35_KLT05834 [Carex littledalei]